MKISQILLLIFIVISNNFLIAQDEEPVLYYQMEPLDDSLFIQIQEEVFIDPPDPKAEIIADLRDPNNQTVQIKGTLYPFLAFTPETRAKIQTYPFKINLEETIGYGSVFTRVIEKMRLNKIISPPTLYQISPTLSYINPFVQLLGGERFGIPIKNDIGISLGIGTPYSGPLETNFVEANFHLLGVRGGIFSSIDAIPQIQKENSHNNLYFTHGFQIAYVIPFGNFFEIGYLDVTTEPSTTQQTRWTQNNTSEFSAKIVSGSYFNFELRYPLHVLGATRGKFYAAKYIGEWHIGFTGRELALAGSVFDFRFDAMPHSDVRQPQYVFDILVQRIFDNWAFSAIALGPSFVMSKNSSGNFSVISLFLNVRAKIGTSL